MGTRWARTGRGGGWRRVVGRLLWLVASAAFLGSLAYGVTGTYGYFAGYQSRLVNVARHKDLSMESAHYAWRDPHGRVVRGRIHGIPEEWDEEYVDGTGTRVWVSPSGVAYLHPPPENRMLAGYACAAGVACCVAVVVWARRTARRTGEGTPGEAAFR